MLGRRRRFRGNAGVPRRTERRAAATARRHAALAAVGVTPSTRPRGPPRVVSSAGGVRRRREPEKGALYRVLAEHLETFLSRAAECSPDGSGLPRFVKRELRGYLRCGILAHGWAVTD